MLMQRAMAAPPLPVEEFSMSPFLLVVGNRPLGNSRMVMPPGEILRKEIQRVKGQ